MGQTSLYHWEDYTYKNHGDKSSPEHKYICKAFLAKFGKTAYWNRNKLTWHRSLTIHHLKTFTNLCVFKPVLQKKCKQLLRFKYNFHSGRDLSGAGDDVTNINMIDRKIS